MPSIEFGLPTGAGGMAAASAAGRLRKQLAKWGLEYKRIISIETDRHDHRHWLVVNFSRDSDLTLFALSWTDKTFMGWQRREI